MEIRLEKEGRSESASYKTFEKYWTSLLAIWLKCIPCPSLTSLPPVSLPTSVSLSLCSLFSLMSCCPSPILYGNYKIFIVCVCFVRGKSWGSQARVLCNASHTHTRMRYHCITHLYTHKALLCMGVCVPVEIFAWKTTNEMSNFLSLLLLLFSQLLRATTAIKEN